MTYRLILRFSKIIFLLIFIAPLLPHSTCHADDQIQRMEKRYKDSGNHHRLAKSLAVMYYNKNLYGKCSDVLDFHLENLDSKELYLLSLCFHKQNKFDDQIRVLDLALKKEPKNRHYLKYLADAQFRLKKYDDAVQTYRMLLQVFPKSQQAYVGLINIFRESQNAYELREILKQAVKTLGPKKQFINELCHVYYEQAYFEPALKTCTIATQKDYQNPDNHVFLGLSLLENEKPVEGLEKLKFAAARFKNSAFAQYSLGFQFLKEKNFSSAFKYLEKARDLDPKKAAHQLQFANVNFELKKYQSALDSFEKACELDRNTANDFLSAASRLRSDRNYDWIKIYDTKSKHCRFKSLM